MEMKDIQLIIKLAVFARAGIEAGFSEEELYDMVSYIAEKRKESYKAQKRKEQNNGKEL